MLPPPIRPADARPPRAGERGAILLVALMLAATFALLALALLATADSARLGRDNAAAIERAERAATDGIEWAAARVVDRGVVDATTTLTLGPDVSVVVDLDSTSPPRVTAVGRANGTTVTLTAELDIRTGAPLPFALASMTGVSRFDRKTTVRGSAYFGHSSLAISAASIDDLEMHGDLHLVSAATPPVGVVVHVSGTTLRSVFASPLPVVDLAPFRTMATGAVPVRRYTGNTLFDKRTLDGVVVVELGAAQVLTIRDSIVRGTVVVTPSLDLLGGGGLLGTGLLKPEVRIEGKCLIEGGTATTGNLALLAPDCGLDCDASNDSVVQGVVLVERCLKMKKMIFTGQLVSLHEIKAVTGAWSVERPAGFEPNTPVGVTWPGPSAVRIRWLGRP